MYDCSNIENCPKGQTCGLGTIFFLIIFIIFLILKNN
jgi:hypothetical protein